MVARPARVPFAEDVLTLLDALSKELMADTEARAYPDVITFAFFCRRRNLEQLKAQWGDRSANRLGRGLTFHIAPANVPINFAYSLVVGLLAGNACIVRAPSKPFPQTVIVSRVLSRVLADSPLASDIAVVRYERSDDATTAFSSVCDVRMIWGGDETIRDIRKLPIPARATELTFADRHSFCVIRASAFLETADVARVAQDFYNDTYLYDQNACSSPRLMVWVGTSEAIAAAKDTFWTAVHAYAKTRYTVQPIIAVDKLTALCRAAIEQEGVRQVAMPDELVDRIHIESLDLDLDRYRSAGGSFLEYDAVVTGPSTLAEQLAGVAAAVTRKCQTLAYIGFDPEELRSWVLTSRLTGIDRIVPVGRTAEFGLIWDGFDLISALSRTCDTR
jgi:hypothetical protein